MKPILLLTLVLCLTCPLPAGGAVPEAEEGAVISEVTETGTAWSVADPQNPTGTLRNGQPVTQENVLALLAEAKRLWPDGMTWTYSSRVQSGNNVYGSDPETSVGAACVAGYQLSHEEACGAFAAMLSDYVFGLHANQGRKLEDNTQVRPGDIIFQMANGKLHHTRIALSTVQYQSGIPFVSTCDGNIGAAVSWDDGTQEDSCRLDGYSQNGAHITCVVYTRYPE